MIGQGCQGQGCQGQGGQGCQGQGCQGHGCQSQGGQGCQGQGCQGQGCQGQGCQNQGCQGQGQDYSLLGFLRMLYRVYDQLMILARFRHLNGNLKLAGLGDGIDLWGCAMVAYDTGGIRAMGLIEGDVSWGARDWIQVMGLICGGAPWGAQHRLDLGDGIDLW